MICKWCATDAAPCNDREYRDGKDYHDISIAHIAYCYSPCSCFLRPNLKLLARDTVELRTSFFNY